MRMTWGLRFIGRATAYSVWAEKLRRRGYDESDVESIMWCRGMFVAFSVMAILSALAAVLTAPAVRVISWIFGALTVIFAVVAVCFFLNYREYKCK